MKFRISAVCWSRYHRRGNKAFPHPFILHLHHLCVQESIKILGGDLTEVQSGLEPVRWS